MTDFLRTLENEAATVSRFIELLKLEQAALKNGDIDSLVIFAQKKSDIASELSGLADQRNSTLSALGLKTDRAGIETWLSSQPSSAALHSTWSQIIALAADANELNRVNGELIRIRMQHNAQALAAIQGASRTLHLYGPDGKTSPHLSRRINDAA